LSPLLHRLPDPPSLADLRNLIEEYAAASDQRDPHAWFLVLCWAFVRELFDLTEESPEESTARRRTILHEFSGLAEFAEAAVGDNATAELVTIANGIAGLLREVVAIRKRRFQHLA
jgi:hypothetical protein